MTEEQIFQKLKEIIADKLGLSEEEITLEANFIDDLGADSLYLNEIVYDIEEEFGIKVPDEDFEVLKTVNQAVSYIAEKMA